MLDAETGSNHSESTEDDFARNHLTLLVRGDFYRHIPFAAAAGDGYTCKLVAMTQDSRVTNPDDYDETGKLGSEAAVYLAERLLLSYQNGDSECEAQREYVNWLASDSPQLQFAMFRSSRGGQNQDVDEESPQLIQGPCEWSTVTRRLGEELRSWTHHTEDVEVHLRFEQDWAPKARDSLIADVSDNDLDERFGRWRPFESCWDVSQAPDAVLTISMVGYDEEPRLSEWAESRLKAATEHLNGMMNQFRSSGPSPAQAFAQRVADIAYADGPPSPGQVPSRHPDLITQTQETLARVAFAHAEGRHGSESEIYRDAVIPSPR
ncbi:hypothetical protein EHS25_007962 [Saitozyma podzolica]|uniref:Uncharacterized protein n=1 Tax=Saitozyma podzolica TaxID=1890683 RepID=A0A427XL20_9TREE|nr:hypothetical protein EHS25_007962 [Saitozyma podzolica]